uniref:non-specific serine/threonine protein kinase n=1 Tax=Ascaris suum TaxID=6253 RepID=F1L2B0_ASCSU
MTSDKPGLGVPSCVAGYNICERIGGGSFSTVYKGISASPAANGVRLTVAIKCMDMHAANASKLSSDCVVSEIKILKSLKHRNIVRLYDFQWDKRNVYLIMEYCGGGDLASFIHQHGSLPEAVTRRFFRQLASALFYMRAMNIAHMDLKPQNILLTNRQRPFIKISDFGLSQYLKKDEAASSFRGSPLYMAPEIFTRQKYDSRVDLWSAGVILYECLYGRPPFTTESYEKLVEQILSHESIKFPLNVQLSFECLDLLQGLLVRNPHHRMKFENFFAHPFVDLARAPSASQLKNADELAVKARQAEAKNDIVEAVKQLTNAIQLYMGCLELFEEGEEKARFREKIRHNLEHAEHLKDRLRPVLEEQQPRSLDTPSEWADYPQVNAALLVAGTARELEKQERWQDAFDKYTLAIEGAMRVLANERRDSARAISLQRKVSKWLSSAERIKAYLEVLNDDVCMAADESDDEAEKQFLKLASAGKPCSLM